MPCRSEKKRRRGSASEIPRRIEKSFGVATRDAEPTRKTLPLRHQKIGCHAIPRGSNRSGFSARRKRSVGLQIQQVAGQDQRRPQYRQHDTLSVLEALAIHGRELTLANGDTHAESVLSV